MRLSFAHPIYIWYKVGMLKVPGDNVCCSTTWVFLVRFFWCPCMAINISVQYNDRLLPDIILLAQ